MIKSTQQTKTWMKLPKHNKTIKEKNTASIKLNGKRLKAFPLMIRNKPRKSAFATSFPHNIGSFSHSNKQEKEINNKTISIHRFYDLICRKCWRCHMQKKLELVNRFMKFQGTKSTQNNSLCFCSLIIQKGT